MDKAVSPITDLASHQVIRDAIRKIAWRGMIKQSTGSVLGAGQIAGYVSEIHADGDLAGTIDVQEYGYEDSEIEGEGLHEGVLLSAIQNAQTGVVIIPKLHSEVIITQDPATKAEHVTMCSHVDTVIMDSFETVSIGVKEREEYDPDDEDAPDIDELEETGIYSGTVYKKDSVITEVLAETDAPKSILTTDGKGIHAVRDKSALEILDNEATISQEEQKVKVTKDTVYVGSDSNTEDAVLGQALADVLISLCDALSQVKTTTQLGPQPFINVAQFAAMKAKINAAKSSHSNFLTKKVQIQR